MATQNLTTVCKNNRKRGYRVMTTRLDYADTSAYDITTSADSYELFVAPTDTYITKAEIYILTPFDSATSALVGLGFNGGDTLINGGDLTSAADTVLSGGASTVVPIFLPTGGTITLTPTYVGATTVGEIIVIIEFIEIERVESGEQMDLSLTT